MGQAVCKEFMSPTRTWLGANYPASVEQPDSSNKTDNNNSVKHDAQQSYSANLLPACHDFMASIVTKAEGAPCVACGTCMKCGYYAVMCKSCRSSCHDNCKDYLSLPCLGVIIDNNKHTTRTCKVELAKCHSIPELIRTCMHQIELRGLSAVGLYNTYGPDEDVQQLKQDLLNGQLDRASQVANIHVVSGCLKEFLRDFTEPLVTFQHWKQFAFAAAKQDKYEAGPAIHRILMQLPDLNKEMIAFIIMHLHKVARMPKCLMPAEDLVLQFAPFLVGFSSHNPDNEQMRRELGYQVLLMTRFFEVSDQYWLILSGIQNRPSITGRRRMLI